MTDAYLAFNGIRANAGVLEVPEEGRWLVDVDYDGTEIPSGPATVTIGSLELVGTVVPRLTGVFSGHVRATVVAGAGGWGKRVARRSYHNDGGGVRRAEVLDALARDTGETIDTAGDATRLRTDFARLEEPAIETLRAALHGEPWRVDFDGVTRYGARPLAELGADVELLDVDARTKVLTFGAPDPASVPIGALVEDPRLGAPLVVRQIRADIRSGATRVAAYGVAAPLEQTVPLLAPAAPLFGPPRKYRLVRMRPSLSSATLTRVELQIVEKATGFPDLLIVPIWPGLAGSRAELAGGGFALVQFIDGDREQPFVSHFATADDPAWRPVHIVIEATTSIRLGAAPGRAAAGVGDTVDCGQLEYVGPGTLTWTHPDPTHIPPTYASPTPIPVEGLVSSGSPKVKVE